MTQKMTQHAQALPRAPEASLAKRRFVSHAEMMFTTDLKVTAFHWFALTSRSPPIT